MASVYQAQIEPGNNMKNNSTKKQKSARQTRPVALVTGANAGIGRAIALALADSGYVVMVNYRRRRQPAEAVARRIIRSGGSAEAIQADVTNPEDVTQLFDHVRKIYDRLDVLINNVGDYLRRDIARLSAADVRRITESNYFAAVECSLQAAALMRRRKSGRIINIGYVYAERLQANPSVVAYHCAKQAMMSFSLSLARHLARHKVTVNVVSPGINVNSVEKPDRPSSQVPFGRLGRYADIVNAVLFLLKPESEYITGTHIKVSGGHGL